MISREGIKAFRGKATIAPKNTKIEPFEVIGDWVYKPETDCWYCNGKSFMSSIVTDIREEPDVKELVKEIEARIVAIRFLLVNEENKEAVEWAIERTEQWVAEVKTKLCKN